MKSNVRILTACIFTALASPLLAANSSLIDVPLTNTGVDADARGRVLSTLSASKSELIVQVGRLAPSTAFQIEVGGLVEGAFLTSSNGAATVKFKAPDAGGGRALDFDPRGKLLRVLASGQSVLQATLSGAAEPAGSLVVERANLRPASVVGVAGKGVAEYLVAKDGRRVFKVELERAGAGPFELFVAGVKRGDFTTFGVLSKIKFGIGIDDAGTLPLNFDPRGLVIDVVRAGQIVFTGELAARANGVNIALPRLGSVPLSSTGADPDGHAVAKLRIDSRARKHFSVEIEDVPAGSYVLQVNGSDVGNIVVTTTASGTKGELEFSNDDDSTNELPLTFDPVGRALSIRQGATVYFQGTFSPNTGNGSGTPAPEPPSTLEESLATTGLDADAKASARYRVDNNGRHKFNIEIEKVAPGDYSLVIAGTVRGTIHAVQTTGGVAGEIEFDSKAEPGHLQLSFDPRGQLIEITSAAGKFFSHLLGNGGQ